MCLMIPRIEIGALELLSGCNLIFQGIYLRCERHTLSLSCTSRMQKVMYRNSIAITITLQGCQAREEIRHTTTNFSNDCFMDLKATTPSQVSLVCLCMTKNSYIIFLLLCWFSKYCFTKTQLPSLLKSEEMMLYPFLRARTAAGGHSYHLICFKYILPQWLTDCRGIYSLRSRRFTFQNIYLK